MLTIHRFPQARARDPESSSRNRTDPDALRNSAERGSSAGRRRPIGFVLAEWNEVFGRAVSIPSRPRLGMQRRRRAPGGTSQPPCSSCMTGACGAGVAFSRALVSPGGTLRPAPRMRLWAEEEGRHPMTCFTCRTCAVQHADSPRPPARCRIRMPASFRTADPRATLPSPVAIHEANAAFHPTCE